MLNLGAASAVRLALWADLNRPVRREAARALFFLLNLPVGLLWGKPLSTDLDLDPIVLFKVCFLLFQDLDQRLGRGPTEAV